MNEKQIKIGIITWHNHGNCGGSLQSMALQNAIYRMFPNSTVEIIDFPTNRKKCFFAQFIKEIVCSILCKTFLYGKNMFSNPFVIFEKKHLVMSQKLRNKGELIKHCRKYTHIVCGSDQIWAPNVFDPTYMIDFRRDGIVKKIAYAPSVGLNSVGQATKEKYKALLNDFNYISVREQNAKDIIQSLTPLNVSVVLDPTFLLDRTDYVKVERKMKNIKKKFIFCYFLNRENDYKHIIDYYNKLLNCQIIGMSKKESDSSWLTNIKILGPKEFLWLIDNAECVFTDSYHATIFSLIFHKNFYSIKRFNDGDELCQNSRINQLVSYFDIKSRVINSDTAVLSGEEIDYCDFDSKLKKLKYKSFSFLEESLR